MIDQEINTLIQSYSRLRAEWASTSRGAGGVAAIKGFDFQLLSAVKKIVEACASKTIVSTEELSDISEFDSDSIVITQSKYCLSSSAVTHALDELWDIYCLILEKYPEIDSCVRFVILGRCQELKNPNVTINNWIRKKLNHDGVVRFSEKISTQISSSPYEEVVQDLIEDYLIEDPWTKVEGWLGKLYGAIPDGNVGMACGDIRRELLEQKNKNRQVLQRNMFHLWKESDAPPEIIERQDDARNAYIVGETPKKYHLIQGRFAKREVYKDIYDSFLTWIQNENCRARGKLPVFWVSGRSGAGKSVALLHLLSMIKLGDRESVVAWFGDKPGSLDALLPYVDTICEKQTKCFLCFDDPYVYDRQDVFDRNISLLSVVVERLMGGGLEDCVPYVICCGPDEQVAWCEENLGDYLVIEEYRLRDENESDIEEIRGWFEKRTGVSVARSDGVDKRLLVQALFEWSSNESLKDFARHFKKRLSDSRWGYQGMSLFELISNVLAVNRLYALFPRNMINDLKIADPNLAKAIHQLEKEDHHITFLGDDSGVKLTHPHLADILYKEWYGRDNDSQYRKNHMSSWISYIWSDFDNPKESLMPLWVIAKLSNPSINDVQLISRVDFIRDDLKFILPGIYERCLSQGKPLSYLPVWSNLNKNFQLNLVPTPLDVIGDHLAVSVINEDGARLSCHKMIEFYSCLNEQSRKNLHQIIWVCDGWHEWGAVALDYIRRIGLDGIEGKVLELVKSRPNNKDVIKITHYLASFSSESDLGALRVLECWLSSCDVSEPSWVANFTDFAKRYSVSDRLIVKAKLFLEKNHEHGSWSHVWEVLWQYDCGSSELSLSALKWLDLRSGKDGGWSFIWEKLSAFFPHDSRLIELGFEYLESEGPLKSKKCVWELLHSQGCDSEKLDETGKDWLRTTSLLHKEWIYIWTRVVIDYAKEEEIFALGEEWLSQVSVMHPSWVDTRTRVLEHMPISRELQDKTILWLEEVCPDHDSWQYLWESAFSYDPGCESLIRLAVTWLQSVSVEHGGWNRPWEKLWDNELYIKEIRSVGINWLLNVSNNHQGWQFVWKRLLDEEPSNMEIRGYAYEWLTNVDANHHSWGNVWGALWVLEENKEKLQIIGANWLKVVSKNHKGKHYVKSKLSQMVTMDEKLTALKNKWSGK